MDRFSSIAKYGLLVLMTLGFVAAPFAATAHADEQRDETAGANYIDSHRFNPSFLILTPFAKPSLTTGLTLAIAHPASPFVGKDLDIAGVSPSFEGNIPIVNDLVLNLKVAALAIAGVNAVSALNYGATTGTRVQLGALWQFVDSSPFAVTGALTVAKPKIYAVSPLTSAQQTIKNTFQGGASDTASTVESTQWYPSVRAAYAINPTFGIQSSFGAQFFSASGDEDARSQLAIGLGLDTQLKPEFKIPVALGFIYVRNQMLTRQGNQDTNTFAFSVFETFSPRFNFGAEFGWVSLPNTTAFALGILARYYY